MTLCIPEHVSTNSPTAQGSLSAQVRREPCDRFAVLKQKSQLYLTEEI